MLRHIFTLTLLCYLVHGEVRNRSELVFRADFSQPTLSLAFGGSSISYGNQNVILWASGEGKLPGLYGGRNSCSGGDLANDCFSTRLMWRANGQGEMYLYANREAQDPAICEMPENYCDPTFGWSLNQDQFEFVRDAWTDIEETVTLNTPGVQNGDLALKINGKEIFRHTNIVFRTSQYPNMRIEGMDVETFFGGNGLEWASPTDQITKFREFILESVSVEDDSPSSRSQFLHFDCRYLWCILLCLFKVYPI